MTNTPEALRRFGAQVDFGRTATDYATHRAGFPQAFFDLISSRGFASAGQSALDIGTGTGTVARGLARLGLRVVGRDPAPDLLEQARQMDRAAGVDVQYEIGTAETTDHASGSFDLITAGQCWHWFDRPRAAREAKRVLRPGGRILIAHFDWLPLAGNVVDSTEALILEHNPAWAGAGGTGLYPQWLTDLAEAGFVELETTSFDVDQPYSHEAWCGRIRASAGIKASLDAEATDEFDAALRGRLALDFPSDPLFVPHRVWLATGCRPIGGVKPIQQI